MAVASVTPLGASSTSTAPASPQTRSPPARVATPVAFGLAARETTGPVRSPGTVMACPTVDSSPHVTTVPAEAGDGPVAEWAGVPAVPTSRTLTAVAVRRLRIRMCVLPGGLRDGYVPDGPWSPVLAAGDFSPPAHGQVSAATGSRGEALADGRRGRKGPRVGGHGVRVAHALPYRLPDRRPENRCARSRCRRWCRLPAKFAQPGTHGRSLAGT